MAPTAGNNGSTNHTIGNCVYPECARSHPTAEGTPIKRRIRYALFAWAALAVAGAVAPAVSASQPGVPSGYKVVQGGQLKPGVSRHVLTRSGPHQAVHVARIAADAPFVLRTVPAATAPGGAAGLERTSSICVRVSCVAAVNGDFWEPATGLPLGGMVSRGQLLRAPAQRRAQLVLAPDGRLHTGTLQLSGSLVSTDLRSLKLTGVDVGSATGVVLYTRASGASTPLGEPRADLTVQLVRPKAIYLGRTALVRMVDLRRSVGNTPIPRDGAVLSGWGPGAEHLTDLWTRARNGTISDETLLRLESSPSAFEAIGGSPVLLRDGRPAFPDVADAFVRGRHPRTLVGRTRAGEALLVTVDGRQPGYSDGMSLGEAAQLMTDLGAVDAINLDGGGSTTFVERGAVANRPSDRAVTRRGRQRIVHAPARGDVVVGNVERPVAVALVVVPRSPATTNEVGVTRFRDVELPRVLALAAPQDSDPGSVPPGMLPAVVYSAPKQANHVRPAAFALVALAAAATIASQRRSRRRLLS